MAGAVEKTHEKLRKTRKPTVVPKHGRGRIAIDGSPGHRGAGGRPPFHIKNLCQKISEKPEFATTLENTACDAQQRNYPAALKSVLAYGWGLPEQAVVHSGSSERVLRVVYEPLPALPRRDTVPVASVRIVKADA